VAGGNHRSLRAVRILAVGNAYPPHHLGGYEVIERGVIDHLREQGHATRVLTTTHRRPGLAAPPSPETDVYRELDWYWHDHAWRALGPRAVLALERDNAAIFDRHLREFEPDVVTWWPVGGLSLGLIERARRAGLPAILFVLDYWLSYGPERDRWIRRWRRWPFAAAVAERRTGLPTRIDYAGAGRWLFCSEACRKHTLQAGLRTGDTGILSPGVERALLDYPPETALPPWRWRLLYLGRLVPEKGVQTAIEALALLPDSARLRIVGDGEPAYRRALQARAADLGVAAQVQMQPAQPRERLPELYREADAVLFPVSWPEPWGLVPLEAMALGRPVLATGRGGSADYLRDAVNSLLFAAGDPGGLAAGVRALAADPELRERLRDGGLATAAQHSEEEFNRRALSEIEAVARRPRPPGRATAPPRRR
jgi:glycogen(starch) synthase